jgi:AcrR family transcriptional regulator
VAAPGPGRQRNPETSSERAGGGTRDRILDAAVEAAAIHGIAKLNVGDVARRARLSRVTLYKHFSSKDELVAAAVQREAFAFVGAVLEACAGIDDPREAMMESFLRALELAREHPLLDRVLQTEPEILLPVLTADGGGVMLLVRSTVAAMLEQYHPELPEVPRRRVDDAVARLLVSYAISAPDDPPEVVAEALADLIWHGALGPGVPAPGPVPSGAEESARTAADDDNDDDTTDADARASERGSR